MKKLGMLVLGFFSICHAMDEEGALRTGHQILYIVYDAIQDVLEEIRIHQRDKFLGALQNASSSEYFGAYVMVNFPHEYEKHQKILEDVRHVLLATYHLKANSQNLMDCEVIFPWKEEEEDS